MKSPFAVRRELELEVGKEVVDYFLPTIDAGQGNPIGYGSQEVWRAYSDLLSLVPVRMNYPMHSSPIYPNIDSPLWQIAQWLSKVMSLSPTDVLEELLELTRGSKYPVQPYSKLIKMAVEHYISITHFPNGDYEKKRNEDIEFLITSGASAACYLTIRSLISSNILSKNDAIIAVAPIYSPIIELISNSGLELELIHVDREKDAFDASFEAVLMNEKNKCLVLVNPGNPDGFNISSNFCALLEKVLSIRPNFLIIEDAAYLPFVKKPVSLFELFPSNTLLLGSFSKIGGMCGVRAGYIAIQSSNFLFDILKNSGIPERYASRIRNHSNFIERCWLEAGDISFSHTGSVPTQSLVLSALFAGFWCSDAKKRLAYKNGIQAKLRERLDALEKGLNQTLRSKYRLPKPDCMYHVWIDVALLGSKVFDSEFAEWIGRFSSMDFALHLAHAQNAICLPGEGFRPKSGIWVRVCIGNIESVEDCFELGVRIQRSLTDFALWKLENRVFCPFCEQRIPRLEHNLLDVGLVH